MNLIFIKLPGKSDDVKVTYAFVGGYIHENDNEFGIMHLAEHYLCARLKQSLKYRDITGFTSDHNMTIHIVFDKDQYKSIGENGGLEAVVERIINEDIDEEVFELEKNRLRFEIDDKYSHIENRLSFVFRHNVISLPPALRRDRAIQAMNVQGFDKEDLKKIMGKHLSSKCTVFLGRSRVKNLKPSVHSKPLNHTYKVLYSSLYCKKIRVIGHRILDKSNVLIVGFTGFSYKISLQDRFALGFMYNEISEKLEKKIEKIGVYSLYSDYNVSVCHGFMWFGIASYSVINKKTEEELVHMTSEILLDIEIEKKIAKFKKNKVASLKKDWSGAQGRYEWMVEDYIDFGRVIDLKSVLAAVNKVTLSRIRSVTRQYLNPKFAYRLRK